MFHRTYSAAVAMPATRSERVGPLTDPPHPNQFSVRQGSGRLNTASSVVKAQTVAIGTCKKSVITSVPNCKPTGEPLPDLTALDRILGHAECATITCLVI